MGLSSNQRSRPRWRHCRHENHRRLPARHVCPARRLREPGWTWPQLVASDLASSVANPRPGAVERVQTLGEAGHGDELTEADRAFIADIDAQLARTANRSVVLYVHGYRVTFDEVAV